MIPKDACITSSMKRTGAVDHPSNNPSAKRFKINDQESYSVEKSSSSSLPLYSKLDPNDPAQAKRMEQRRKMITKGKNTAGYDAYVQQIPKHKRRPRSMETPSTPDPTLDIPNKRWQGLVKAWYVLGCVLVSIRHSTQSTVPSVTLTPPRRNFHFSSFSSFYSFIHSFTYILLQACGTPQIRSPGFGDNHHRHKTGRARGYCFEVGGKDSDYNHQRSHCHAPNIHTSPSQ
jgi:hypothetical protein